MIYTFYSYKGGVGRTMALANIAELFYRDGKKVLMVDWDLEAPGLERFFFSGKGLETALNREGLMDLLLKYKEKMAQPGTQKKNKPEDLLAFDMLKPIEVYPEHSEQGKLWLLTAGKRSGETFSQYARNVMSFDWMDFYDNWRGEIYFELLRREFEKIADVVLIDSRTGVTEMGGVCTYQMADTILAFCAPNQQNIDGTFKMVRSFTSDKIKEMRHHRPLDVLVAPSRIERAESPMLDDFQQDFFKKFKPLMSHANIKKLWTLNIPYVPKYAYNEIVAVREHEKASAKDMRDAYNNLYNALTDDKEKDYVLTGEKTVGSELPGIPDHYELPSSPFCLFSPYETGQAGVFFGRTTYIRKLYNLTRDKNSPPVAFLYSSPGAGKTSLLKAGIIPRLKLTYQPVYIGQREGGGFLESLLKALSKKFPALSSASSLKEKWRMIKKQSAKPLVIILDHADNDSIEEFFTLFESILKDEMPASGEKLIISLKEEDYPEISAETRKRGIEFSSLYLEPLDKEDIMEVVTGLTESLDLRTYYKLEVERELPPFIARDLTDDEFSPIAPFLQFTLTLMWGMAFDESPSKPEFTLDLYRRLRKKGICEEDFFLHQIKKIREWNKEAVDSGLALDVLKFHTSSMGVSRARSLEHILEVYQHRQDILETLLRKLKDVYLLVTPPGKEQEFRLVSNRLAFIVIREHYQSTNPGQRSRRILEEHIGAFRKNEDGIWLHPKDLKTVREGLGGMRNLSKDEIRLLELSRKRKTQHARRELIIRILAGLSLVASIILLILYFKS